MKMGLIRCLQIEDLCPATTCFKVAKAKKLAFEGVEGEIEVVGMTTCGGCPGKRAVNRAEEMVNRGADTIVFASCITRGTPIGFVCPHAEVMMRAVRKAVGDAVRIIDYTH